MSPFADLPCWVIMKCGDDTSCPAKENPESNCWEIFTEADPKAFNICQDCLVYLTRQEVSVLSREEMEQVLCSRGIVMAASAA